VEIPETISTVFQKNSSEYNLVFWGFDSKLNKWFSFDSTVSSSDIIKIIQCSNYDWVYVQLKYAPDFVNINITYEVEDV
jgi:hypothetical protein